ncbi:MAG: suppressor of fused domain protein [Moraxella sp.]|nr:suppressor of fused domain protein [Moraxella sp.]
MNIINHLERHINTISSSFIVKEFPYHVSISIYDNSPMQGLRTYTSLGLSRYCLDGYHYEIVFCCDMNIPHNEIAYFLLRMIYYFIHNNVKLLRGDVFEYQGFIANSKMSEIYVSLPFCFDDEFQVLAHNGVDVIFPLLIPIYHQEAKAIRKKGWQSFEAYLMDNNIDNLFDISRSVYTGFCI